jgi:hypothetical protein
MIRRSTDRRTIPRIREQRVRYALRRLHLLQVEGLFADLAGRLRLPADYAALGNSRKIFDVFENKRILDREIDLRLQR